jgi:hypothetical protein
MGIQRKAVRHRAFALDEAYSHVAVAANLYENGTYGYQAGQSIAASQDALWRLLIYLLTWITRDATASALLLGAVCSLITLLLLLRLARLLFPFPPFIMYTAVVVVLSAGFLPATLSGQSLPLVMCLVTAACMLHIEGLTGRNHVLPFVLAMVVGMLAWIRIEFSMLWLLFALHAVVYSFSTDQKAESLRFGSVFLRGIIGFFVIALCCLPLMIWNAMVLHIPWPRPVGAPMALDAWRQLSFLEALRLNFGVALHQLPDLYLGLFRIPFLDSIVMIIIFVFGLLVLGVLAVWRQEERPFTLFILIPLLFPPLFVLAIPYTGNRSVMLMMEGFQPVVVLIATFGLFRVPFLIEGLYRKYRKGLPSAYGFNVWWIVTGTLFFVVCLFHMGVQARSDIRLLKTRTKQREKVVELYREYPAMRGTMLTDQPGWIAACTDLSVLDLNGDASPQILMCLQSNGRYDYRMLRRYLQDQQVKTLLFWSNSDVVDRANLPVRKIYPPAESEQAGPSVWLVTWSGAL